MSVLETLLPFIIVLCAMIVIHEFGHFIVAKLLGIPVETFSVGFGPRLFGFKLGDTDYRVSAIPLGGVKFRGENLELMQGKSEARSMNSSRTRSGNASWWPSPAPSLTSPPRSMIPTAAILVGFHLPSMIRSRS